MTCNRMKQQLRNLVDRKVLLERMENGENDRTTVSFYQYARILNPAFFRDYLFIHWNELGVLGRTYVAREGINAQISVPTVALEAFQEHLYSIAFLDGVRLNAAVDDGKSFFKLMIKVRDKIVADGLNDTAFDVRDTGVHLDAEGFNSLTAKEDTILIDMRNHYESEVGHFKGAITPDVDTFREEIELVEDLLQGKEEQNIVMYCTGGIRCEKASAWLKHKGFPKVHQLEGGIIEYTRQVRENGLENRFIGKNFVFDERRAERIFSGCDCRMPPMRDSLRRSHQLPQRCLQLAVHSVHLLHGTLPRDVQFEVQQHYSASRRRTKEVAPRRQRQR